jgi:expansin (peptidoglycan-binding protein)
MSAPSYCDTANDGSSENVVALSADIMTQELCGKSITVTAGGKTATGTVVDRCAGCSSGSVDMSEHMFGTLASMSAGRIPISWVYN